jgi:hypothetical protein
VNDEILAYLRQNRGRYTREALTQTLVEAGHELAAVEAAWQQLEAVAWPPPPANERAPAAAGRGTTIAVVLLALLVIAVYGFVGYLGFVGILLVSTYPHRPGIEVILAAYIVAMLIGAIISLAKLARAPSTGRPAAAIAGAMAISFVIIVGLSGLCLASIRALG